MEESSTYQLVLRRGRIEGIRESLIDQGAVKFGQSADAESRSRLESITDLERVKALAERLLFVTSWADLLAET